MPRLLASSRAAVPLGLAALTGLTVVLRLPFLGSIGPDEGGYAYVAREWAQGDQLYRTIWIDRLAADCPGLNEANTTIVEAGVGGQYCRGDRVRGLEPGAIIAGPGCNLGDWVPYRQP